MKKKRWVLPSGWVIEQHPDGVVMSGAGSLAGSAAPAEANEGVRLPVKRPPLAPGAPEWVAALRDNYFATGRVRINTVTDRLRVGEKLVALDEYEKIGEKTLRMTLLPIDDDRVWRVERCDGA